MDSSLLIKIFCLLNEVDSFYWKYIGFTIVIVVGVVFCAKSRFYQFWVLIRFWRTLKSIQKAALGGEGLNPFHLYFASVGGMIGLGNIIGVVTAVMVGGPGSLFWLWVASLCGMLIKYAEVYLGMKFRAPDENGGYHGGPMMYLRYAFKTPQIAKTLFLIFCGLLAFYGIEVYQFVIITDTIVATWNLNKTFVLCFMLLITLYGGFGGIGRLANICTAIMPLFIIVYLGVSFYIIGLHIAELPAVLKSVFVSAFTGHAALGSFVGSSMITAAQLGTARAVYSGDLGIGYDSIIQSESRVSLPELQACLSIFGVVTNALVCTVTVLVVLVTGIWHSDVVAFKAVTHAFIPHFPYADIFMALLIFIAGYTTVIAYLAVGVKAIKWLFPKWGREIYFFYSITIFICFSFVEQNQVLLIMSLSGGFLMLTNLVGIWKLRHSIEFNKFSLFSSSP